MATSLPEPAPTAELAFSVIVQCHSPESEAPRQTGAECLACPHHRGLARVADDADPFRAFRGRCAAPRGRALLPVGGELFVRCPEAEAKVGGRRGDIISATHCRTCEHFAGPWRPPRSPLRRLLDFLGRRRQPAPRYRCTALRGVQYARLRR
jgi:hypothetical protein